MSSAVALLVLGMHRSGTSAVTGALQLLGVELGNRLAAGHAGINDLGYFEHVEILDLHDALLADLGSVWDDVRPLAESWWTSKIAQKHAEMIFATLQRDFAAAPFWGVKDPRLCRLVPLWHQILARLGLRPVFLLMLRRPDEVAGSLARRDGMGREKASQLWLEHTLAAERWSRGYPRAFVTYDQLLAAPPETLAGAARELGLAWPKDPEAICGRLRNFLSPEYQREKAESLTKPSDGPAATLAFEIWSRLSSAGVSGPDIAMLDGLQQLYRQHLDHRDPALLEHLSDTMRIRLDQQRQLAEIRNSLAWKIARRLAKVLP